MKKTLYMYFNTSGDTVVSLSVDDPRDNINAIDIRTAMDSIIAGDVIYTSKGSIVSAHSAKIVEQKVTEIAI